MSHKLRMHYWQNGALVTLEHEFETYEIAKEFASNITKGSLIKIYNEYNELVDNFVPADFSSLIYG